MTEQTNDMSREDVIAAAETKVAQAQAVVDGHAEKTETLKLDVANARAAKKESAKNLKDAKAYKAALAADDENHATADESVNGWAAADEQRAAAVETAVEAQKAHREAIKADKADLREAKKELATSKKTSKPKVEREKQNGITKPIDGGPSNQIWDAADAAQAELGRVPGVGDILPDLEAAGIKTATIKAAYAHWRKFHGITGRVMSQEQLDAQQAKVDEKARKAQEKADAKAAKEAEAAPKAAEASEAEAEAEAEAAPAE